MYIVNTAISQITQANGSFIGIIAHGTFRKCRHGFNREMAGAWKTESRDKTKIFGMTVEGKDKLYSLVYRNFMVNMEQFYPLKFL